MITMFLLILASGAPPSAPAAATGASVPVDMQGTWARKGRCDLASARLTITAHDAGWGRARLAAIHYDADESAIEWDKEGDVDNFVLAPSGDVLVHNIEGFGMPEREGLARCGAALRRTP